MRCLGGKALRDQKITIGQHIRYDRIPLCCKELLRGSFIRFRVTLADNRLRCNPSPLCACP
jgi:hypothetical protein